MMRTTRILTRAPHRLSPTQEIAWAALNEKFPTEGEPNWRGGSGSRDENPDGAAPLGDGAPQHT